MKTWQADCEDGWKSKDVKAENADKAADMVQDELVAHVKEVHNMDLPKDPMELHKSVVEHMHEVMMM
ncbi:MAG: hypothetical protein UT63_C0023G0002 [Candidatus Gottesmanbacteria bacterium GW2011_GWC2_39_8]|uniref:DUF1059 domain-containing protein n=1 Tax=Candidatus Gottesmanbacteria bacterium GW2011_GWC2_39_8 TaxID=1618450 RepID=A0A0G0PYC8_9BACT|nr:MAG: hypothetical protein UT63_C0023G0002 [Candidatus Gottesmanbacteria bacterium GW2011_GWC2_39_8]